MFYINVSWREDEAESGKSARRGRAGMSGHSSRLSSPSSDKIQNAALMNLDFKRLKTMLALLRKLP